MRPCLWVNWYLCTCNRHILSLAQCPRGVDGFRSVAALPNSSESETIKILPLHNFMVYGWGHSVDQNGHCSPFSKNIHSATYLLLREPTGQRLKANRRPVGHMHPLHNVRGGNLKLDLQISKETPATVLVAIALPLGYSLPDPFHPRVVTPTQARTPTHAHPTDCAPDKKAAGPAPDLT